MVIYRYGRDRLSGLKPLAAPAARGSTRRLLWRALVIVAKELHRLPGALALQVRIAGLELALAWIRSRQRAEARGRERQQDRVLEAEMRADYECRQRRLGPEGRWLEDVLRRNPAGGCRWP